MARIDIDNPYTTFLESQVKAGLFNTISEAARDAIRKQMELQEQRRVSALHFELEKGEVSLMNGKGIPYSEHMMNEISQKGKDASLRGQKVRSEVKP